jgi:hypothetical protein
MNLMNQAVKKILWLLPLVALVACGGGSGGAGSSSSNPPPATNSTQAELKQVAALGILITLATGAASGQDLAFLNAIFEGLSADVGGSRVVNLPCTAGTASVSIVKSAPRTGLVAGDGATFTYDRCDVAGSGYVLSGKVNATAQSAVVPAVGGSFSVDYAAVMTGLSATYTSVTLTYDGVLNISSSVTDSTTYSTRFVVPAGQLFTILFTGAGTPLSYIYSAETTFAGVDNVTLKTGTRKLDGSVTARLANSPILPMAISTPTTLTGTTSSTNVFTATAGTITSTSAAQNIATSTTINGANATVSGDTDKNGSLDLTFSVPWAALFTP